MVWQYSLKKHQPIIKAKKTKKAKTTGTVKEGGDTIKVISSASLKKAIEDLDGWFNICRGLSGNDIGVTGKGWSGKGNKLSLLDHVAAHVDSSIAFLQRPNQPERTGSMGVILRIKEMLEKTKAYKDKELKLVHEMIEDLKDVEGGSGSKTNPRNITFNIPETWTPKEIESKKKIYGHYRTPKYVEYRTEIRNKDEMDAVDSSWYSDSPDTAKPPFWQALFAGGKNEAGGLVTEGLLAILIRIEEEMEEQELEKLHVKGKFQRMALENVAPFMGSLELLLKNQGVYHSADVPFKRLTINFAALKREIQKVEFQLTEQEGEFVKKITGHDDLIGELTSFYIDNISITLLRTIIKKNFNLDRFKHGKYTGIFLRDAARDEEARKVLFNRERVKARKDGNLPFWARDEKDEEKNKNPNVKKSWGSIIRKGL